MLDTSKENKIDDLYEINFKELFKVQDVEKPSEDVSRVNFYKECNNKNYIINLINITYDEINIKNNIFFDKEKNSNINISKYLICKYFKHMREELIKGEIEYLIKYLKEINEPNSLETVLIELRNTVDNILSKNTQPDIRQPIKTDNVRYNDLGQPMLPLEKEVAEMLDRSKKGEQIFPKYERAKYGDPVVYLEMYYGKYLNIFNGGKGDYLYVFQLEKIDDAFKENLRSYLNYHGKKKDDKYYKKSISDFVSNISVKSDKEADIVLTLGFGNRAFANKVKNLVTTRVNKRV